MKLNAILIGILSLVCLVFNSSAQQDDWPVLKGPSLGQKPPGKTPELFAKGIISTELHDDAAPVFTLDGKEVYFRIVYKIKVKYYGTIFFMRELNGQWSYPGVAPFSGKYMDNSFILLTMWEPEKDIDIFISFREKGEKHGNKQNHHNNFTLYLFYFYHITKC